MSECMQHEADLREVQRQREVLQDALRRIRYIAGHKSTTPGSAYDRIYQEATAALPSGDVLRFPDRDAAPAAPKEPR